MAEEKRKHVVEVGLKDLYQMLIMGNRYGCSRNNHLEPWGAFDHCKVYLPKMMEADKEWGTHTARQLCEEAIGELWHFKKGYEGDPNHNWDLYIDFIWHCIHFLSDAGCLLSNVPYNIDNLFSSLERVEGDDSKKKAEAKIFILLMKEREGHGG